MANGSHRNKGSFKYKDIDELQRDIEENDLDIKLSNNMELHKREIKTEHYIIPNSLASLPMEGGDSDEKGSPTELTYRKYENIARGGSGLIWLEAVSVSSKGRSNDKQLLLTEETVNDFKKLNDLIKKSAKEEFGEDYNPITILQLNHSGRYCKKDGKSTPVIATHKRLLDNKLGIDENYPIISDDYLKELEEDFLAASRLAKKAGYDGVDIKACHGYLLSELLSAYEREGIYGGDFESRTKLMIDIINRVKADKECEGLIIASRMNIYDAVPYPQGWGVNKSGGVEVDLEEPKKLISILEEKGVSLISLTMGNPYFIPHINKPSDILNYTPEERPIESCNRLIKEIGNIQQAFPNINFVGVGYSWFRQFAPQVAAGSLENNLCKIIGFGREGIAYPEYARDIFNDKEMKKNQVCISCNKCSEMKAKIGTCGCVVRDSEVYLPMYKKMKEEER